MHGCRPAVSIFYLVLRALDTVEDDMTIPLEKKVLLLKEFHTYLYQPEWKFTESQEKDKAVLEDFPAVSACSSFIHVCRPFSERGGYYLNLYSVRLPSTST